MPSGTRSSRSTSTCSPASPAGSTPPCPTSPPGTRRRCAAGTTGGSTCSCSPSAGRPASSSTWPGRSPAWGRSSPTPIRRTSPSSSAPWWSVTGDEHEARVAADSFTDRFGASPEGVWAAPGRVNVIGEHTDYNGGYVLPVALPHTTRAAVARRDDALVALASLQHPGKAVEIAVGDLAPGRPDGWAGYPAGVVHELRGRVGSGLSILVDGDVPSGAGLSSSAALECAVALALRDLLGLDLSPADLVAVARRAENDFVGAPTGILDQSAALLCTAGHALFLDTLDRSSEQVPLDLAAVGLALLVIDSGVTHDR